MNAISKDDSEMTPEAVVGPGTQLRKARERLGLDQAKMAAQLHLSQAMIAALEVDDYDNLPGPVFVQGYLRKYSRLLGVNEAAIIEAYQNLFPVSDELPIQGSQKQELGRDLHSGHGIIRYVTWGILLILVGLLFFWWQNRVELEEPESVTTEDQSASVVQDPVAEQVIPQSQPVVVESPQPAPPSEEVVTASERLLNEIDEVITSSEELFETPNESPPQPVDDAQSAPANLPAQVMQPAQQETQPAQEVVAVVSKRVVFLFNEACWTEVRDRNGKLRIFGELAAGKRRTLDSRLGPFSVLLGNAAGVELNIAGEAFDLKPFTRGKVARFTLDPNRL
ncbi:MAG: RodZ domain-containing protein [Candidatus Thiodiazotropha sp.]